MDCPPITGVAEVVLSVRDLPRMRKFYREVLGFEVLDEGSYPDDAEKDPDPDADATIVFLTVANVDTPLGRNGHPQLVVLIDFQRHASARARLTGHDVRQSTLNHLAFEIPPESYDLHLERLGKLGLEPVESEFPDMRAKAMFFKDPEGNTLELICHDGS